MTRNNRASWNAISDRYQAEHGAALRNAPMAWGVWRIPESELRILGDLRGREVLELGCGAAQWTIAMRREGIRATGVDLSERQLAHARARSAAEGVAVPLVQATAERLPFRDGSFDVVFADHGAPTFAPPDAVVAEAARILRPGGVFAFCMATPLLAMCWGSDAGTATSQLRGDYFSLGEIRDGEMVEYQLPYGAWIRLFRRYGFAVEDLIELSAPEDAATTYDDFVTAEWARRWPAEHIWKVRRE
jgi:SAM-dependent methyltransferase